jgi:hypothetical protein
VFRLPIQLLIFMNRRRDALVQAEVQLVAHTRLTLGDSVSHLVGEVSILDVGFTVLLSRSHSKLSTSRSLQLIKFCMCWACNDQH